MVEHSPVGVRIASGLWAASSRKDFEYVIKNAMQNYKFYLLKSKNYTKNNHLSLIHENLYKLFLWRKKHH